MWLLVWLCASCGAFQPPGDLMPPTLMPTHGACMALLHSEWIKVDARVLHLEPACVPLTWDI
jgi:hypothetical protein